MRILATVSVQPEQPRSGTVSLRRSVGAAAAVAEELLTRRGPAVARRLSSRERNTEALAAGLFVLVAMAMPAAIAGDFEDGLTAALLVLCYALLRRVRFQLGPGLIRPTQLAFVPMAFLTPAPWVPALVGLGSRARRAARHAAAQGAVRAGAGGARGQLVFRRSGAGDRRCRSEHRTRRGLGWCSWWHWRRSSPWTSPPRRRVSGSGQGSGRAS